jgi:sigma-B regulation protein RsbU (phosphoserine phosphatase)
VIYVDNRMQTGIFTQPDMELLTSIASSAAIAIENARLYQVAVEKGRLERELQMAREVQASLLPREIPALPGWEFCAGWLPARQVAGDYYDFIPGKDGQLGLVIADVTDKGMPAALFMALTRSILRASMDRPSTPAEGITHANQLICADATSGMFVTLFYARFTPESGQVTYVNAGHNPPLLYKRSGDQDHADGKGLLLPLQRTGMALGVIEGFSYHQETIHLEPGDFILFYTDGVTDALNAGNQEFGTDRLEKVILDNQDAPVAEIVAALESAVAEFIGSTSPFDDITIVAARRI